MWATKALRYKAHSICEIKDIELLEIKKEELAETQEPSGKNRIEPSLQSPSSMSIANLVKIVKEQTDDNKQAKLMVPEENGISMF